MGFYATASEDRAGKSGTHPLKNRVWGLDAFSFSRTGSTWSETQCSRPENDPTATTTASGMRFYGYRFYSPEMGRWLNRDPIAERGGNNLYGFVENDPLNLLDILGRESISITFYTDKGLEFVRLTLDAADITSTVEKNAQKMITEGLEDVKNSIRAERVGGGPAMPIRQSAKMFGTFANLSSVGDEIVIPKSQLVSGAADLYAYLKWTRGGAVSSFETFVNSFETFLADKSKTDGNALASCLKVCISASNFIADVPHPGLNLLAKFYDVACQSACCNH